MRISDWSSDVCSSDLQALRHAGATIDEDFRVVSENELSRPVTLRRNHRTAGAEKDDFHDAKLTERRRDAMEKGRSQGRPFSVGSSSPRSRKIGRAHV